jgi:uncharacterized protein (TIGR04141 family)
MAERHYVSINLIKKNREKEFLDFAKTLPNEVVLAGNLEGSFYPMPTEQKIPSWMTHVGKIVPQNAQLPEIQSQQAGGLLHIRVGSRVFVITFGHAWQKLQSIWREPDFGRKVALNAIKPDDLVGIRAEQVFAGWHIADERAPRASNVNKFGVEFDRDLVSAVEGRTDIELFGESIRGGTALRILMDFERLVKTLQHALTHFTSQAYKKVWPEIDNLIPVLDGDLTTNLNGELDTLLKSKNADSRVILATPGLREGLATIGVSYILGRKTKTAAVNPYLTFASWDIWLKSRGLSPSLKEAHDTPVHLIDHNKESIQRASIYECLGCEISYDGNQYIISSGQWYLADDNFIKRVNAYITNLSAPDFQLPAWDKKKSEGQYNSDCEKNAKKPKLVCLDATNVMYGGGQSKFELCDLICLENKTLYFAKIPTRSAGASHLYEQVRRTVDNLFGNDDEFRKKAKEYFKKAKPGFDVNWLDQRPRVEEWHLCLVSLGRAADKLPFFAKCGLYRLVKELEKRYHVVRFQNV